VAESVLPTVEALAKPLEASLILFQAITPVTPISPATVVPPQLPRVAEAVEELHVEAERYLSRIGKELETRGLEAKSVVNVDFAVAGIVNAARDLEADLIALGTHGRSGVVRWVMGSVADAVVRRTRLPCLLIRPEGEPG
jgi:nucleotide-binding universal stress UspA family protein